MSPEQVRECMSEYDVDNGRSCLFNFICLQIPYPLFWKKIIHSFCTLCLIIFVFSFLYTGGVIEMSEFSLFIRNQAKEAERKLKVNVLLKVSLHHYMIFIFLVILR